ncbi:MAG: hypothetical protein ABUS48_03495 [Pseudomonadota bacterium]
MADTITIDLTPESAAELRRMAAETGETVEAMAQSIIRQAVDPMSLLSPEQLEDLRQRVANPGPLASEEEMEEFFSSLRPEP